MLKSQQFRFDETGNKVLAWKSTEINSQAEEDAHILGIEVAKLRLRNIRESKLLEEEQ